ncbi:hypothetical protein CCACVL1_19966 [Corchorus capsularis]|uniref:Uncharacterized protein n=1 Tax=Corchorus capsularis TaxID=210143 RepID=A0A1R3HDI9_COCAP|nr:hypothetical protein CCACVL1_19966 [Corchorus capsularis]
MVQDIPHEQQIQVLPFVMAELQRSDFKEQDNATLWEQLQLSEFRWLETEAKMKSMEAMWQKQMA